MSEQASNVIQIGTSTVYAFPRRIRHTTDWPKGVPRASTDEALTFYSRNTLKLLRNTYRDLRRAGVYSGDARLRLWLLMNAPTTHITVDRSVL